jgi:hypothetical protein
MQSSNELNPSIPITEVSHCLPVNEQTGKGVRLTLSVNPDVADQVEEFEAVANTNPRSIQEFLIRLNELQKQKANTNK